MTACYKRSLQYASTFPCWTERFEMANLLGMARPRKLSSSRPQWAARLEALRILAGLTQTELAAKVNVSQQSYSNYERGKDQPKIETLLLLSDALGQSVDYILRGQVAPAGVASPNGDQTKTPNG